jgi:hypothetical protein
LEEIWEGVFEEEEGGRGEFVRSWGIIQETSYEYIAINWVYAANAKLVYGLLSLECY